MRRRKMRPRCQTPSFPPSVLSASFAHLIACGFEIQRQSGSQVILTRPGLDRPVVVPQHKRELPPGFVADIVSAARITREEFLRHV